jgi:hypothetical protein
MRIKAGIQKVPHRRKMIVIHVANQCDLNIIFFIHIYINWSAILGFKRSHLAPQGFVHE